MANKISGTFLKIRGLMTEIQRDPVKGGKLKGSPQDIEDLLTEFTDDELNDAKGMIEKALSTRTSMSPQGGNKALSTETSASPDGGGWVPQ